MKFEIKSRWNGSVIFTAEIAATIETPLSIQLGLAIKKAWEVGASLVGASLVGASLVGARLDGARLDGARLDGASLDGASLDGASLDGASLDGASLDEKTLRSFKADFWMILTKNRDEVSALIAALREGRVDGSTYNGACACLMGTIANAKHVSVDTLEKDSNRPAEQWFLMIRRGDKPDDQTGGGFASRTAIDWALEWCALNNIKID